MGDSAQQQGPDVDLSEVLGRVFGFHAFRANQEEIVRAVLARRDVFAVMPTGGGKSLCYQLPAHVLPGTCIVISPLISLMKDQVDAAKENGLAAECLHNSLPAGEHSQVLGRLIRGELDLLYVAPERFTTDWFLAALERVSVCLFAIDEAHCISEWGHDFRPDYLALSVIVERFSASPVAAFTATATHRMQGDIIERLGLRDPHTVRGSFDRPILFYQVVPKDNLNRQLLSFVRARDGDSGIIYRRTRNDVEGTAAFLVKNGVQAVPYHAGLDADLRKKHQEAFNRDEVNVVVATIAFGMGIDKSNVRFVLHGDLPKNVEGYYQETGRAGRDGEPAHCVLYFSGGDVPKIRYFVDQIEDEAQRTVATSKLYEMVNYSTVNACRRRQLLGYFGEELAGDNCGACDVCAGEVQQVDATTEAQIVMSAIVRTGQRFGAAHVVDVVTGAKTQRIAELGHDQIKTYGAGQDRPKHFWRGILNDLIAQGGVVRTGDKYPVLHVSPSGREVLFGRQGFHVLKQKQKQKKKAQRRRARAVDAPAVEFDDELFARLRTLRTRLAKQQNVPPYIVFSDRTLHEMAAYLPATPGQMNEITGVGEQKLKRYGKQFLAEIASFVADRSNAGGD